jgi:hypothetical protein
MPQIQRKDIPRPLFAHLLQRIQERSIDAKALESLAAWLDTKPEVPEGEWFKRFKTMTVCGEGPLVKTFLTPSQVPFGQEL